MIQSPSYKKFFLKRELLIRKCRKDFWTFCKVLEPDFYLEHREHLKEYCKLLQDFIEDNLLRPDGEVCDDLMINEPPQHGKSRTIKNWYAWVIGKYPKSVIGNVSYNDAQSTLLSQYTRDLIKAEKVKPTDIVYSDIFPEIKLKHGDKSVKKWSIEGRHITMKSGSSVTGTGFTLRCIDDPIKDSEVALNPNALDKIWNWITGTFLSRRGSLKVKTVIIMTRWASEDPCGKFLAKESNKWVVHSYPVEKDGYMLCPDLLSKEEFDRMKDIIPTPILNANYYNILIDFENRIFKPKYYHGHELFQVKNNFEIIFSVFDPAKGGGDFASCLIFGLIRNKVDPEEYHLYLLDFLYTDQVPDIYEPILAELLVRNKVEYIRVEKNNGGHEIGKNIDRIARIEHGEYLNIDYFTRTNSTEVDTIAKGQKLARILAYSSKINKRILFPFELEKKNKEAYNEYINFNSKKNKHDDFTETLALAIEVIDKGYITFSYADTL